MHTAECLLESKTPYSQSKHHETEELSKEHKDDYEKRTWRERAHYDEKTRLVYIPPMQFANAVKNAAAYLSEKIPGKDRATWTKHFKSGILVADPIVLDVKVDDVECDKRFVPYNGKAGGGSRVWKYFPIVSEWKGSVTFYILDDLITEDIFTRVLGTAGSLIGIGRFRPANGGMYGRFICKKLTWKQSEI